MACMADAVVPDPAVLAGNPEAGSIISRYIASAVEAGADCRAKHKALADTLRDAQARAEELNRAQPADPQ